MLIQVINHEEIKQNIDRLIYGHPLYSTLFPKIYKFALQVGQISKMNHQGLYLYSKLKLNHASATEIEVFKKRGLWGEYFQLQLNDFQLDQIKEVVNFIYKIQSPEQIKKMSFEQMIKFVDTYKYYKYKHRHHLQENIDFEMVHPSLELTNQMSSSKYFPEYFTFKCKVVKLISKDAFINEGNTCGNCIGKTIHLSRNKDLYSFRTMKDETIFTVQVDQKTGVVIQAKTANNDQLYESTLKDLTKEMNWYSSESPTYKKYFTQQYFKSIALSLIVPFILLGLFEFLFLITDPYYSLYLFMIYSVLILLSTLFCLYFVMDMPNCLWEYVEYRKFNGKLVLTTILATVVLTMILVYKIPERHINDEIILVKSHKAIRNK